MSNLPLDTDTTGEVVEIHEAFDALSAPRTMAIATVFDFAYTGTEEHLRVLLNTPGVTEIDFVLDKREVTFETVCTYTPDADNFAQVVQFALFPESVLPDGGSLPLSMAMDQVAAFTLYDDIVGAVINTALSEGEVLGVVTVTGSAEGEAWCGFSLIVIKRANGAYRVMPINLQFDPDWTLATPAPTLAATLGPWLLQHQIDRTAEPQVPVLVYQLMITAYSQAAITNTEEAKPRQRELDWLTALYTYNSDTRAQDAAYRALVPMFPNLTRSQVVAEPIEWTEYPTIFDIGAALDLCEQQGVEEANGLSIIRDSYIDELRLENAEDPEEDEDEEETETDDEETLVEEDDAEDAEEEDEDSDEDEEDEEANLGEQADNMTEYELALFEDFDDASGMAWIYRTGSSTARPESQFVRLCLKHHGFALNFDTIPVLRDLDTALAWWRAQLRTGFAGVMYAPQEVNFAAAQPLATAFFLVLWLWYGECDADEGVSLEDGIAALANVLREERFA